jgi:nucleoid-associated protein YgaU
MADTPDRLKLDEFKLECYEDAARIKKVAKKKPFNPPISVKDFSQFYGVRYRQKKSTGAKKKKEADKNQKVNEHQALGAETPTLKFDFILDNTVVFRSDMGNKPSVSVVSQVKEFLGICYKEDKVTPRFLKITWGESIFDCVLQSSDIKYSLFDQSGTPLRATITATFLVENMGEVITEEGDKSKVNKQHVVKKGDSLPMIAVATYGSVAFLLPLARYNGVKHLREIKSGTTLDLPAVDVLKKLV